MRLIIIIILGFLCGFCYAEEVAKLHGAEYLIWREAQLGRFLKGEKQSVETIYDFIALRSMGLSAKHEGLRKHFSELSNNPNVGELGWRELCPVVSLYYQRNTPDYSEARAVFYTEMIIFKIVNGESLEKVHPMAMKALFDEGFIKNPRQYELVKLLVDVNASNNCPLALTRFITRERGAGGVRGFEKALKFMREYKGILNVKEFIEYMYVPPATSLDTYPEGAREFMIQSSRFGVAIKSEFIVKVLLLSQEDFGYAKSDILSVLLKNVNKLKKWNIAISSDALVDLLTQHELALRGLLIEGDRNMLNSLILQLRP